ncbi:MAG TPA: cytochrome c [Steroidobacteraceae bacterium]|nr:cytochrome c [Steroidobacteraceae bacterium]
MLLMALSVLSPVTSGCSGRAGPGPPAGLLASAAAQRAGARLFAADCAVCHGDDGDGHGARQEGLNPPPADLTVPPWSQPSGAERTFQAIRQGVRRTAMASWPMLSEAQIWQLVAYIEALAPNR